MKAENGNLDTAPDETDRLPPSANAAGHGPTSNSRFSIFNPQLLLFFVLAFLGCRSVPPPPPAPLAASLAERAEQQAAKLSQQMNWPAAARAWELAADRFSLLNDLGREAIALHNLAQTERELDHKEEAHRHLAQAASLNEKIGRTNQWWRNQIALLQVEAENKQTATLEARYEKLLPLAGQLHDRSVRGLFLNELGLWQQSKGELAKAEQAFGKAEQEFQAAHDSMALATILANRAELSGEQGNYPAAIQAWKAALAKSESLSDPDGIARALAGQGRALLAANQDLPRAEDMLRRAGHNYDLLHANKQAQATLESLARCLSAQGKEKEAEAVRHQMHELH